MLRIKPLADGASRITESAFNAVKSVGQEAMERIEALMGATDVFRGVRGRFLGLSVLALGGAVGCAEDGEDSGEIIVVAPESEEPPREFTDPGSPAEFDEYAGPVVEDIEAIVAAHPDWIEVWGVEIKSLDKDFYIKRVYLDPHTDRGQVLYWLNGGGELGVVDVGELTEYVGEFQPILYVSDGDIKGGAHVNVVHFGGEALVTGTGPQDDTPRTGLDHGLGKKGGFYVQSKNVSGEVDVAYSVVPLSEDRFHLGRVTANKLGFDSPNAAYEDLRAVVYKELGLNE